MMKRTRVLVEELDYPARGLGDPDWQRLAPPGIEPGSYAALRVVQIGFPEQTVFLARGPRGGLTISCNESSNAVLLILGGFAYCLNGEGLHALPASDIGYCSMSFGSGLVWAALSDGMGLLVVDSGGRFHYEPSLVADNLAVELVQDHKVWCLGGFVVPHEMVRRVYSVERNQGGELSLEQVRA